MFTAALLIIAPNWEQWRRLQCLNGVKHPVVQPYDRIALGLEIGVTRLSGQPLCTRWRRLGDRASPGWPWVHRRARRLSLRSGEPRKRGGCQWEGGRWGAEERAWGRLMSPPGWRLERPPYKGSPRGAEWTPARQSWRKNLKRGDCLASWILGPRVNVCSAMTHSLMFPGTRVRCTPVPEKYQESRQSHQTHKKRG